MRDFKFLSDNIQFDFVELSQDSASWIWDSEVDIHENRIHGYRYELVDGFYNGIFEFLSNFPNNYIVVVHSITDTETGIQHTATSPERHDGWGFNIQTSELIISHYRIVPTNH